MGDTEIPRPIATPVFMRPRVMWEELQSRLDVTGHTRYLGPQKMHIYGVWITRFECVNIEINSTCVMIVPLRLGLEKELAGELKRLWPEHEVYIGDKLYGAD